MWWCVCVCVIVTYLFYDLLIILRINIFKGKIPILKVLLMYLISKYTTTEAAAQKHLLLSDKLYHSQRKNSHLFDKTLSSINLLL